MRDPLGVAILLMLGAATAAIVLTLADVPASVVAPLALCCFLLWLVVGATRALVRGRGQALRTTVAASRSRTSGSARARTG